MQKMSIATSDGESEDVTQFTILPSLERNCVNYVFDNYIAKAFGILFFLLLFYALFFLQTSRLSGESIGDGAVLSSEQQMHDRPKSLHNLLHKVAATARIEGALSSVSVAAPVLLADKGIEVNILKVSDKILTNLPQHSIFRLFSDSF